MARGGPHFSNAAQPMRLNARVSLKCELRNFQGLIKYLIKSYLPLEEQRLFSSPRTYALRLFSMGITNAMPRVSFLPHITTRETCILRSALLMVRGKYTTAMQENENLMIPPGKISYRRRIDWHRHVRIIDYLTPSLPPPPSEDPRPCVRKKLASVVDAKKFLSNFCILCPACKTTRHPSRAMPRTSNGWHIFVCNSCQHNAPAHKWHCACCRPWRNCEEHSKWPDHVFCLRHHSGPVRPTNGKRSFASTITTQPTPSCSLWARVNPALSPGLAAKFPHLVGTHFSFSDNEPLIIVNL